MRRPSQAVAVFSLLAVFLVGAAAPPPNAPKVSPEVKKKYKAALSRGRKLEKGKDYKGAVGAFQAALAVIPDDPWALSELGWAAYLAKGLPGINPAVLCTGIVAMWLVGLFTYFAARAVDEHRFAVAMSHYVMPTKDLDQDLERLSHQHPDQMARDMAHRLEVKSAALPVLAASVLLPVTALFVIHAVLHFTQALAP